MLYTNAVFKRKDTEIETKECVVDKVIRLSGVEFDRFTHGLMREWDFIRDNPIDTVVDKEGRYHCLLVVSDDRRDGILVNPEGSSYAYYSAFIPNVESFLMAEQYPALAELNKKLTDITNYITEQSGERVAISLEEIDIRFDINLEFNDVLLDTVIDMLDRQPEIEIVEFDKNELIIYREPESLPPAEDLSDPSVSKTDMYAYGYAYDGVIPLGRERALELFDKGQKVLLLYGDDTDEWAGSRHEIELFDGMLGIESSPRDEHEGFDDIEVFIVNRERQSKGVNTGEWLKLPSDADTLCDLFERIGVDRPSEGAFTVTAVRLPYECLRDHVTKYDSLDEINMLASFLKNTEDFNLHKFQVIVAAGIVDVSKGTESLISLLYDENLNAFNLIDDDSAEMIGQSNAAEKPDGVSFKQYGYECIKRENGIFTEWGYLYSRFDEVLPEYTGTVPDKYKITGEALRRLRSKMPEREQPDKKQSVVEKIRAARTAPRTPKIKNDQSNKKSKGGQEL